MCRVCNHRLTWRFATCNVAKRYRALMLLCEVKHIVERCRPTIETKFFGSALFNWGSWLNQKKTATGLQICGRRGRWCTWAGEWTRPSFVARCGASFARFRADCIVVVHGADSVTTCNVPDGPARLVVKRKNQRMKKNLIKRKGLTSEERSLFS